MGNKSGKSASKHSTVQPATRTPATAPASASASATASRPATPTNKPNTQNKTGNKSLNKPNLTVNPNAAPLHVPTTLSVAGVSSTALSGSRAGSADTNTPNGGSKPANSQQSTPTKQKTDNGIDPQRLSDYQRVSIQCEFSRLCTLSCQHQSISRQVFCQLVLQPIIQHLNLNTLFIDRIYNSIDTNKNGTIEYDEFESLHCTMLSSSALAGSETKMRFAYNVCDIVGNNKIDKKVWKLVICALLCGNQYDADGNEVQRNASATNTPVQGTGSVDALAPSLNITMRLSSDITSLHPASHSTTSPNTHRQSSTGSLSTRAAKRSTFNLISSSTADAYTQLKFGKHTDLWQRSEKVDQLLDNYFFFVLYNYDRDNDRVLAFNEFQRYVNENDELAALADAVEPKEQFYTQYVTVTADSFDDRY